MRRYPSPCFSLYREALKILVAGLCEDTHCWEARKILVVGLCEGTHPLLLSI